MELAAFIDELGSPSRSLVVVNRESPDPIANLLAETFEGDAVDVAEVERPDSDAENLVALVGDGEVRATSPLSAVRDAILLVNSDIYTTGGRRLEAADLPAVLARLDDVALRLRGFPASNREKLLLIAVSRFIERRAWRTGTGTLRSSFQRLSRIEDELGTRRVYERVADAGVDAHVYGVPDREPPAEMGVTVHGGTSPEYRQSWVVVFTPDGDADADADPAALVAVEAGERDVWRGFWTYRPDLVERIDGYVRENL